MKRVGIIGFSGRMGRLVQAALEASGRYVVGSGYDLASQTTLDDIFRDNHYVIDFSSPELTQTVINAAQTFQKPLALCTTGQDNLTLPETYNCPIVIAPNTSIGACLQRYLAKLLAIHLPDAYDIDLIEKHHRHKKDAPSGTAQALVQSIQSIRSDFTAYSPINSPRAEKAIGIMVQRAGSLAGEHEITFTSEAEQLSIRHIAFDRALFADGALKIIDWFDAQKPQPGLYNMFDVLGLTGL